MELIDLYLGWITSNGKLRRLACDAGGQWTCEWEKSGKRYFGWAPTCESAVLAAIQDAELLETAIACIDNQLSAMSK